MRIKNLVFIVAALFLVAACETAPSEDSAASGQGASSSTSGSASQPASSSQSASQMPAGPAKGSAEDFVVNVGDRVFFDFDKSNIRPDQRATLEKQAAWLKGYPQVKLSIEGHCDERGTREYNLALGERRANAVKDFLVALGINPDRLQTVSYGKERPAAQGHNEAAWAQNRRGVSVPLGVPGS